MPKLLRLAAGGAVVLVVLLCGVQMFIQWEVRAAGNRARRQFTGDRVEALIRIVDCPTCGIRQRDHAVWALGELSDARALPVLQKHRTGMKCDHERSLCQYELGKAEGKIQGAWGLLPYLARVRR